MKTVTTQIATSDDRHYSNKTNAGCQPLLGTNQALHKQQNRDRMKILAQYFKMFTKTMCSHVACCHLKQVECGAFGVDRYMMCITKHKTA